MLGESSYLSQTHLSKTDPSFLSSISCRSHRWNRFRFVHSLLSSIHIFFLKFFTFSHFLPTSIVLSGKSTVSKLLSQTHSIPLIDLDILAREVVQPGQPTLKSLTDHFGSSILLKDGSLDRPTLGRIIFQDESQRKVLNSITHSAIRKRMTWLLIKYWLSGEKVVVVDTPLLVEAGMWKWCGEMVLVWW